MIVSDKKATVYKANEMSKNLLEVVSKEIMDFKCIDDPAENIYLVIHTISILSVKLFMALESYCNTYGISNITIDDIYKSTCESMLEYLEAYKNKGK